MRPVQKTTAGRESSTADSDSDTKINVGQFNCSAWLPIESAPKDGTRVFLACETYVGMDYKCGMWVDNYGCPGWCASGQFINPIYWMPIPALPNMNVQHCDNDADNDTDGVDGCTDVVDCLWSEDWHGFRLSVIRVADGFRSVVSDPGDEGDAIACRAVYTTKGDARRRCWGMVCQICDLRGLQAASHMKSCQ